MGCELNADINGAINILGKGAPKDFLAKIQWSCGDIISPQRLKLVNFSVGKFVRTN